MKFKDKYPYRIIIKTTGKRGSSRVVAWTTFKKRLDRFTRRLETQKRYLVRVAYTGYDKTKWDELPVNEKICRGKKQIKEIVQEFTEPELLRCIYD